MKKLLLIAVMALFAAASYAQGMTVTVSIPPQKYIIDRISDGKIKVNIMVPGGSDPHTFSPKVAQIKALTDSKLYFAVGFPFEESMIPQISKSHKNLTIVHTQEGVRMFGEEEGYLPASYIGEKSSKKMYVKSEKEAHLDPHIWTSPKEMMKIAENTYNALVKADPANRTAYETNYNALTADIRTADSKFTALFNNTHVSRKFLVYHPAWGYFARDYGLEQYAVEVDGKAPRAKELKNIIERAKAEKITVFLVQPQHSADAADTVAKDLGIKTTFIDILGNDWLVTMTQMYSAFAGSIR